jgi:hypothetical protein
MVAYPCRWCRCNCNDGDDICDTCLIRLQDCYHECVAEDLQ